MLIVGLFFSTLFLAYSNGANDNFKGVATLYGSGIVNYRIAILIATVTTFLGSVCAIFVAQSLVGSFSGKGLVPQAVAGTPVFLIAVGLGAACTVFLATRLSFPISTTHSLVGGMLGAGVVAVGKDVNFSQLGGTFFLPLLISPLIAFALGLIVYGVFSRTRKILGINKESCICIGEQKQFVPISVLNQTQLSAVASSTAITSQISPKIVIAENAECVELYTDRVWGVPLQKLLDGAHILSAAAVSFARGLNDTPKIAGLLVAAQALDIRFGLIAIAVGMAIGGLLNSRGVAETMSKKITSISHGQGFSANLVTSFLVIVASKFGVPVSTTHVAVGSLFGISMLGKRQNTRVIRNILLSWLITLPVAMFFSAAIFWFVD